LRIDIPKLGQIAAYVENQNETLVQISFADLDDARRDILIRMLFTQGLDNSTQAAGAFAVTYGIVSRILRRHDTEITRDIRPSDTAPPKWIIAAAAN
ncbi:MAG: hypothetical protein KKB02_14400, partial [Alphaproteobacteria bacterium]|nr:hypothetical protein [Alphaproteobacteria bacterium]